MANKRQFVCQRTTNTCRGISRRKRARRGGATFLQRHVEKWVELECSELQNFTRSPTREIDAGRKRKVEEEGIQWEFQNFFLYCFGQSGVSPSKEGGESSFMCLCGALVVVGVFTFMTC